MIQPWSNEYENDFEKQIYCAINLCRFEPKRFIYHVKDVAKNHELAKNKDTKDLIKVLQQNERLNQVKFDEQANEAVRKNNAAIIAKNEAIPTKGGNIDAYNTVVGSEKTSLCEEYTMCQFEGSSAQDFIAL